MDDSKLQIREARKRMNQIGATLLVYYIIMNIAVSLAMVADLCVYLFTTPTKNGGLRIEQLMERIMTAATSNGWGYILAIVAGGVILLLWKGKAFCSREIFAQEKKMTPSVFAALLAAFVMPQALVMLYSPALEWLLNQWGLSATAALEIASIQTENLSMFLYASLLGPVAEELLFRGLVLRLARPWGKQTAIFVSALLFGLFHGNVIQIPFAFLIGLVLGYVTVEYSIIWAIVLHIFNNFVLSDLLGRLEKVLPQMSSVLMVGFLLLCSIAAAVLLILKREQVIAYFRENKMDRITWKGLVTSPVVWIFTVLMLLSSLLTITKL